MKATFEIRSESYHVDIRRIDKPEGEQFELFEVTVHGQDGRATPGILKLTGEAVELGKQKAEAQGGSTEDWLARGCARALAAERAIRKLKPNFSFVVDHRWISEISR